MLLQFRSLARLIKKHNFKLDYGYTTDGTSGCLLSLIGMSTIGVEAYQKIVNDRWTGPEVSDALAAKINVDVNKLRQLEAGFEEWTTTKGKSQSWVKTNHPQYKVGLRLHKAFRED